MSSDISKILASLSQEQIEALEKIIQASKTTSDSEQVEEQPLEVEKKSGRTKSKKTIVTSERESVESSRGRGRTSPARTGQRAGKTQARTEPVRLSKENKFLKMRERNGSKSDSLIDKKLWLDREVTERPEKFEYVEAQCKVCLRYFDIHPALAYIDEDTGNINYTCNSCSPRGN